MVPVSAKHNDDIHSDTQRRNITVCVGLILPPRLNADMGTEQNENHLLHGTDTETVQAFATV